MTIPHRAEPLSQLFITDILPSLINSSFRMNMMSYAICLENSHGERIVHFFEIVPRHSLLVIAAFAPHYLGPLITSFEIRALRHHARMYTAQ